MTNRRQDDDVETPHAVPAKGPPPESHVPGEGNHQDDLLDAGLEETFPASDPVSVKRIT